MSGTHHTNEPTIIDLCRSGDFVEAQKRLEAMGDECTKDPDNYALTSAYVDLCSVLSFHLSRRAATALQS